MKDISVRGNQHIIIVTAVRNFHLVTDKFSFSNFFRFLNPASRITLQNGRTDGFRKRGSSYFFLNPHNFPIRSNLHVKLESVNSKLHNERRQFAAQTRSCG